MILSQALRGGGISYPKMWICRSLRKYLVVVVSGRFIAVSYPIILSMM